MFESEIPQYLFDTIYSYAKQKDNSFDLQKSGWLGLCELLTGERKSVSVLYLVLLCSAIQFNTTKNIETSLIK